jgi:transcriptional regulator with PAS, ATPase and Fis domain
MENLMKKILAIVSYSMESVNSYYEQIISLFQDNIIVNKICIDDLDMKNNIDADVILVPSFDMFEKIKNNINKESGLIFATRTISKSGMDLIRKIKPGTEVVLIDESPEMAEQIITVLYQLGVRHIELQSYWNTNRNNLHDKTAIILGQTAFVPEDVKNIVNIGNSLLDINSILDLGDRFDLFPLLDKQDIIRTYEEIEPSNVGLLKILGLTNSRESQLEILLQFIDAGVIGIGFDGNVFLYNENAKKIIGLEDEQVINEDGIKLFEHIPFEQVLKTMKSEEERLVKINGYDVVATVNPIRHSGKLYGAVAIIRKYVDMEKQEHILRRQLIGHGHNAKYNFDDIIGNSNLINECKSIAKRMSKSESSILVTGETGTGKELFSQAIHNNSKRKKYQFVAVNCGAFPENLLESELFGYEEGAFTGARKGGKPGLFELAHKGTLFLDEITEMPMNLQVKLLRALQERQIVRIGGDRLIDVDIRVIAATNKDIKKLVAKGDFRQDLFYRLNVLPLKIPPLRDRKEDIMFLAEYIKKLFKSNFSFTDDAKEMLIEYDWSGNVRELRNCVEYLVNLDLDIIDLKDLPFDVHDYLSDEDEGSLQDVMVEFLETAGNNIRKYIFVLDELEKGYLSNKRLGRRSISETAKKKGVFISEQEIRTILINLEKFSMAEIYKGRSGTLITEAGRQTLKHLTMSQNR